MSPLVELRAYFLLILPVRLVLGLLGLAGARALGVSPSASIWLFGLGAVLFGLGMLATRRRQAFFERAGNAQEIDGGRAVESRARTLARSAYPSTLGVSALTLIALPINAALAALLAGLLAGMAIVGAVFGLELVQWEQSRGVRLFALPGQGRSCSCARPLSNYDPPVQKYVLSELDSGQRLITERIPSVRSVALGFWIGGGSRDETPSKAGISHFIEHLLFKGTRSYSAQDIAEIFDALGGELNAATSREHTLVYVRVADHHLDQALDVMSDMVYAPLFADLDSEREVVLEEIAMYEDTPHELVHDLMSEAVFGDHPLGRPVIGTADVISSVGRRALTSYHQTMYQAGNVVVAAAGNLKHDGLVAQLEKAERKQGKASGKGPRLRSPLVRPPRPSVRFQRKRTEQYHVCIGAPGIARSDRRRFAASVLDALLGGSASSRLFQEIREKRGMAYSVYTFASQYTDSGLIGFYVGTRSENLADCLEIANEQITEVAEGGLRKGEIERAKENLKGRILLSMESTSNRMSRLGKSLISDTELLSIDRIAAEIDAVTPEAVSELAGVLLAPERLSASGIGPSEERFRDAVRRIAPELPAARAAA